MTLTLSDAVHLLLVYTNTLLVGLLVAVLIILTGSSQPPTSQS